MQAHNNQRGRRVRQGRAGRRSTHRTVDPEALKRFWTSLTIGKRLQLLQFEDRDLVERAYVIQQMLWYSELMCIKSGVRVSDGAARGIHTPAMEAFEFKWQATWLRGGCIKEVGAAPGALIPSEVAHDPVPAAFAARVSFVDCEDFLERLQDRLGSPLLDALPALRKEEWASVFEPTANSWAEYERQVWILVMHALVQAFQDAAAAGVAVEEAAPTPPVEAPVEEVAVELSDLDFDEPSRSPTSGASPSAKRRQKKRRKAAALAAGQGSGAKEEAEALPSSPINHKEDDDEAREAEEDEPEEEPQSESAVGLEGHEDEEEEEDEEVLDEEAKSDEEVDEEVEEDEEAEEELEMPSEEQEVMQTLTMEDDGFSTWETVSRKRDRQRAGASRAQAAPDTSSRSGAIGSRAAPEVPTDRGQAKASEIGSNAGARSGVASRNHAALESQPAATATGRCAVEARSSIVTAALSGAASSGAPETPPARREGTGSLRDPATLPNAWRPGRLADSAARWHTVVTQASEDICFMASVKRTFLDVEAVFPSERMRPRARSHSPVIVSVC